MTDWILDLRNWLLAVVNRLASIADWLEEAGFPLNLLEGPARTISEAADGVFRAVVSFTLWVLDLETRVALFVTRWDVSEMFQGLTEAVLEIWAWFLDRVSNIRGVIEDWWAEVGAVVSSWLAERWGTFTDFMAELSEIIKRFITETVPDFIADLDLPGTIGRLIEASWTSFWNETWPSVITAVKLETSLGELRALFKTPLEIVSNFGEDIVAFFADPEQWVYDRLDSFFERFW